MYKTICPNCNGDVYVTSITIDFEGTEVPVDEEQGYDLFLASSWNSRDERVECAMCNQVYELSELEVGNV